MTKALFDALKTFDENSDPDWPRGLSGQPKLILSDAQADRFIAAGLLTEGDVIRRGAVHVGRGTWEGFRLHE